MGLWGTLVMFCDQKCLHGSGQPKSENEVLTTVSGDIHSTVSALWNVAEAKAPCNNAHQSFPSTIISLPPHPRLPNKV